VVVWRGGAFQARRATRSARELGRAGEAAAEEHLRRLGCTILARNYRCRGGEIDLVVSDGATIVFVEVKTRKSQAYGSPLEAVDPRKQHRLAVAAHHFILSRRCGGHPARFDVIGVGWHAEIPQIEHVRNAFELG
jgi:putative endonuclease